MSNQHGHEDSLPKVESYVLDNAAPFKANVVKFTRDQRVEFIHFTKVTALK